MYNGGVIGPVNAPTLAIASGVWGTREARLAMQAGAWPRTTRSLYTIIQALGLTSGLVACWDPADSASYSGSGQNFNDLSGNASHLYRGTTSGADATDPTFNGVAGALSENEYFSSDGGDLFRIQSHPAWADTFHKDNALFSMVCVLYRPSTARIDLAGTNQSASTTNGFFIAVNGFGGDELAFYVSKSSAGNPALNAQSTANFTGTGWRFFGVAVDEAGGAGASHFYGDGAGETFNGAYTSPTASNATSALEIGGTGGVGTTMLSGGRMGPFAIWTTKISVANMTLIRQALQQRISTLT
jgi:hypothetical protein